MLLQGAARDIKDLLQTRGYALNAGRPAKACADALRGDRRRRLAFELLGSAGLPAPWVSQTLLAASHRLCEDGTVSPASLPPASPAATRAGYHAANLKPLPD